MKKKMTRADRARKEAIDLLEVGDKFIDPMDGEIREVMEIGRLMITGHDAWPYMDESIFTTDGGCVSPEEAWNNIVI